MLGLRPEELSALDGKTARSEAGPKVLLGVTASQSLGLLGEIPARLTEAGARVHLVSSATDVEAQRLHPSASHHSIRMQRQPAPADDLRALAQMWRLMGSLEPDVVVMGTPKASLLGLVAARLRKVPKRVYHLRGLRLETERGWRRALLASLERVTFLASFQAIAVSHSLQGAVESLGLSAGRKVEVLGAGSSKGVDAQRFRPCSSTEARREAKQRAGLDPGALVVGFVGRLTKDKGVCDLLAASEILWVRGCQHQVLLIGGSEDGELSADVARTSFWSATLVGWC